MCAVCTGERSERMVTCCLPTGEGGGYVGVRGVFVFLVCDERIRDEGMYIAKQRSFVYQDRELVGSKLEWVWAIVMGRIGLKQMFVSHASKARRGEKRGGEGKWEVRVQYAMHIQAYVGRAYACEKGRTTTELACTSQQVAKTCRCHSC